MFLGQFLTCKIFFQPVFAMDVPVTMFKKRKRLTSEIRNTLFLSECCPKARFGILALSPKKFMK